MACFMLMHLQLNDFLFLFFACCWSCWWLHSLVYLSVKHSSLCMCDTFILLSLYLILNQNFSLWLLIIFGQISDHMMYLFIDWLLFIFRATKALKHCLHRRLARKRWWLSCLSLIHFNLGPLRNIVRVMIRYKRPWRKLFHKLFLDNV